MNDQERITDLLLTEKKMSGNYNIYASECTNTALRDDFLKILNQGHMIQTDLFNEASNRGWYKTCPADSQKVSQAYQKYSAMAQ